MEFPLYVTCCLSLAAFNILSLCLVFVSLISMCPGVFLLGFILYGTLCLLDLTDYFLFHVGEIFIYGVDGGLVTKSCLTLAIPRMVACQAPLSMGFYFQL